MQNSSKIAPIFLVSLYIQSKNEVAETRIIEEGQVYMEMMEEYWSDVLVYYVEFTAQPDSNATRRIFRKHLVFPVGVAREDVFHLVPVYFDNIAEVLHVDEVIDGLLLKSNDL